jgi:hypothetical protein
MNLERASLAELEKIFVDSPAGPSPRGRFRGRHLGSLPGTRRLWAIPAEWLLFEAVPFGIDFQAGRGRWWFVRPTLAAGAFDFTPGPSRWRPTETQRLVYERSRLPGPIRRLLYDELKMLDEDTGLGIGGLNLPAGRGEHFFFMLHR